MTNAKTLLLKGVQLASAQLVVQIMRFVRNVILARLLTPADFGVAATFSLTTAFLMTITEFGIEQMLIRDKDGDSDKMGATAQSFILLRGVLIGCLVFLFAGPFMSLLGAPSAANSFRWIGVGSILSGMVHRDTLRMQRNMRFGPSILSQMGPDVIVTLLAWPIASWCGNYKAFVLFSILHSFFTVATSHLLAERPYRLGWDSAIARKCLKFGWPLFLNTILMFFAMQGDRIVLAKAYTQDELGYYSVAIGLAMTPSTMLLSAASQLIVPTLAKVQDSPIEFRAKYLQFLFILCNFAILLTGCFVAVGPWLINFIFGNQYVLAGAVIGPLAFAQSIRLIRAVPTTAALAKGDAKNSLFSNVFRLIGFVAAAFVGVQQHDIIWIAYSGILGEILALVFSTLRMQKAVAVGLRLHCYVIAVACLSFGLLTFIQLPMLSLHSNARVGCSILITMLGMGLCSIPFVSNGRWSYRQERDTNVNVAPFERS